MLMNEKILNQLVSVEQTEDLKELFDIYSRLLKERIISWACSANMASYYRPTSFSILKKTSIFISIIWWYYYSGMGIYDTMQYIALMWLLFVSVKPAAWSLFFSWWCKW